MLAPSKCSRLTLLDAPGCTYSATGAPQSGSALQPEGGENRGGAGSHLARVLRAMTAFRVVRGSSVLYLDTPLGPQLYKQNRLSKPGRVKGDSWDSHGRLLGAPPASAGPRNISPAYAQRAEGSFPVLGPLWKTGRRRLALRGGRRTDRPAMCERFPRA